jgi:hypothetical protein
VFDLVLASDGDPVVVGYTYSRDFRTTDGAFDRSYNGGSDGFVTRFELPGG